MKRALLVIDVQNEYFSDTFPVEHPPTSVSLPNIGRVMDAARAADIPIVVVQHSAPEGSPIFAKGSRGWELHPEIARRGHDHLVEKTKPSSFTGTDLREWLAARGIDTLTLVGYMTHNCDAATTFEASHAGFAVEILSDASGSLPYANRAGSATAEEIHRVFSVVFQSNFAAVMTTAEWLDGLRQGGAAERDNVFMSNRRARGMA
ncbi:cysteine hydrolase [Pendulispora brunnea]|uniref:Cysteine hydrolase n=1 Tax=Pendulispora brunnea TaxID=2905690 RepID=A0ABZ2JVI4_9BACT